MARKFSASPSAMMTIDLQAMYTPNCSICRLGNCGAYLPDVSSATINSHVREHHDSLLAYGIYKGCSWPGCAQDLKKHSMLKHIRNVHFGGSTQTCSACGCVCSTQDALQRHMSISCRARPT